jgi:hypothetical protein
MTANVTQVTVVGETTVIGVSGSVTAPVVAVNITSTPVIQTSTTTIPSISVEAGVQGPPGPAGAASLPDQTNNGGKFLGTNGTAIGWTNVGSLINGSQTVGLAANGNLTIPGNIITPGLFSAVGRGATNVSWEPTVRPSIGLYYAGISSSSGGTVIANTFLDGAGQTQEYDWVFGADGTLTLSDNSTISPVAQVGYNYGPYTTDIYNNTTGGAIDSGHLTYIDIGTTEHNNLFNAPIAPVATITGTIAANGNFTPGTPTRGTFNVTTSIRVGGVELGSLNYRDDNNPGAGLRIGSAGDTYSGPTVTAGTLIEGWRGRQTVTPKTTTYIKWGDGSTTQITGSQVLLPNSSLAGIVTTDDVSGKSFPARLYTANYSAAKTAISVNSNQWQFGTDGTITFPDNTIQTTAAVAQIQSDWTQATTSALDYIKNKPTIPAAQIQSDWTQATTSALDYIKNKPALFSGSYTDLTNKPTIPSSFSSLVNNGYTVSLGSGGRLTLPGVDDSLGAMVQSDESIRIESASSQWLFGSDAILNLPQNGSVGAAVIQPNAPTFGIKLISNGYIWTYGTDGKIGLPGSIVFPDASTQTTAWTGSVAYANVTGKPTLATVATSGSYADLSNKPAIGTIAAGGTGATTSPAAQTNLLGYTSTIGTALSTTAVTGSSPSAGSVTLTFAVQGSAPFAVNSYISVQGVAPTGYNGLYQVTACTTTTVTYANATTTAVTTQGVVAQATFLTNTSSFYQTVNTGSSGTAFVLPDTSTLSQGWSFRIDNASGINTSYVYTSTGVLVGSLYTGSSYYFTCISTSVNTAAGWRSSLTSSSSITGTGTMVLGNSPTITGSLNFTGTSTSSANFGTVVTTGLITVGGVSGTGSITIGRATTSQPIQIGSGITTTATTASGTSSTIATTVLTVGGTITGTFSIGMSVTGAGVLPGTYIISLGTGVGGAGTYNINLSQTVSSATTITGTTGKFIDIGINGASGSVTNITLGSATSGATSTTTINGSMTIGALAGLLKGTAGVVSAATAGTDYQAPVSATGILKSNGTSGNVSAASAGTDYIAPYGSTTANYVLAAPNGSAGTPAFRALVAADIPALSYLTSITSSNVTTALGYTPIQASSLSITTAAASGAGSLSYSAGVFTFTPAASATWPVTNTNGSSGPSKVSIGTNAGATSQGVNTVAIGNSAGQTSQGGAGVSIGFGAGNTSQGAKAIAIGLNAGSVSQGADSIAIGGGAGSALTNAQAARTIILNASGNDFDGIASQTDSFYVAPIRTDATPSNVLYYNTTTKEVTYGTAPVNYTLPTATTTVLGGVKVDGTTITINGSGVISGSSSYSLPTASGSVLGGIKIGSGLSIDGSGVVTASGGTTLPSQTGNNGKYLTTDGSTLSWATVAGGGSGATVAIDTTDTVLYPTMANANSGSFTTAQVNNNLTYNGVTSVLSTAISSITGTGMNLIYPSQGFSATYWTVSALAVTANNILAPDGTTTGALFTGSGASGGHYIYGIATYTASGFLNSTNLSRTVSCYFQKGTNNFVQLTINSSDVTVFANFDLNNGVLGTVGAGCTATISTVAGYVGWYRCTMTFSALVVSNVFVYLIASATAVRAESNTLSTTIYAWGMQCEYGPTARTYQATTAAYVYGTPQLQINNNNVLSLDTTGNLSFGGSLLTTSVGTLSTTLNIANSLTSTTAQTVSIATGSNSGTKTINIGTGGGGANITLGIAASGVTTIASSSIQSGAATASLFTSTSSNISFATAATALAIGSTNALSITTLNAPTVIGSNTTQNLYNTVATTVNEFGAATTINVATNAASATTWTLGNPNNSNSLVIAGGTSSGTDSISTTITTGTMNVFTGVTGTLNVGSSTAGITGWAATATTSATAASLGYIGTPINTQAGTYTLVIGDMGKTIYAGGNLTIPANASVAFPVGTIINIIASAAITVAITSDTLQWGAQTSSQTGTRNIAQYGMASLIKVASTTWYISGGGIT